MALLKVKVLVPALAQLMGELEKTPNQFLIETYPLGESPRGPAHWVPFVKILPGDRKFDGEKIEAHLELLETYPTTDPDREMSGVTVQVGREMRDRLDDILGIYPRTNRKSSMTHREYADLRDAIGIIRARATEIAAEHKNCNASHISTTCDGILTMVDIVERVVRDQGLLTKP